MATPDLKPLIDRLDRLIELLEKQHAPKRTPIPDLPDFPPMPEMRSHCKKCGMELGPVMGYVCPHPDCPTGMGLVMS